MKPRWSRHGLSLKDATQLAEEWIKERYGDSLETVTARVMQPGSELEGIIYPRGMA